MASPEFHEFQALLEAVPPPAPSATLEEIRALIDERMAALPLAAGTSAEEIDARGVGVVACRRDEEDVHQPTVLYFHGGGYTKCSAAAYRAYGTKLADAWQAEVLVIDYRLAPEHPFPSAVDDARTVYEWLLDRGFDASRLVLAGDSAGGGIACSLAVSVRDSGLPPPGALVCLSPWVDLRILGSSYDTRAGQDNLYSREAALANVALYLGEADPSHPLASPVLADWQGLPPLLVQVGDAEVLLDDALDLARTAASAGVEVVLHTYPEMPHVWQTSYPAFPESVLAVEEASAFIERVIPPVHTSQPSA